MLAITVAGIVGFPVIVVAAAAADLTKLRFRFPTVRVAVFLVQNATNDSVEILLAPIYWVLAGFGTQLDHPSSVRRHERLQAWSIDVLARRAERLLGLHVETDPDATAACAPAR